MKHVVIGSRGSDLALWQANFVKAELEKLGCSVTINIIKTQGDIIQHLSFDKLEGKGFFTKEIEAALLNKSIDLAVHSHKDLETNPPEGLIISCVSERANPSDVLLVNLSSVDPSQKWSLKLNATVGTSSVRRKTQVLKYRPDSKIVDIRGNVPTRIDKLRQGNYDAILLAKAGLDRLGLDLSEFKEVILDPSEFVPAPAQGVLGLQIRSNDNELHSILQSINFPEVQKCISLERKVLNLLEGGCQLPLGVYCNENHELFVSLADNAGKCVFIKYTVTDFSGMAEKVVSDLNKKLSVV
jgi:hydroxymethylbilane synthase